jgi:hypothetical protein
LAKIKAPLLWVSQKFLGGESLPLKLRYEKRTPGGERRGEGRGERERGEGGRGKRRRNGDTLEKWGREERKLE